jgi:hypothetical protein
MILLYENVGYNNIIARNMITTILCIYRDIVKKYIKFTNDKSDMSNIVQLQIRNFYF